jgi:TolB-like protein/cytochrome c-type biogenesis protein CcmH/NrfG
MKLCPTCNLVETDDALRFCRADGTTLISYSGPIGAETGTVRFDSDQISGEIETSILPHTTTPEISRSTGPTTALPAPQKQNITRELVKPKRRGVVFALLGLVIVIAAAGYFYWSRNYKTAIESIAVMPFVNESGNADVEYLSDGMTETLISSLSKLPNLSVKARSSVFRYKGKATDAKTIGAELGVQAILNGRVVQRGDRLILTLELVDAQTENVIWSDKYDRKQTDLLTLQNDIAKDVSLKLKSKLSGEETAKVAKNYTANPEAYQLYLKGLFEYNKITGEGLRQAAEFYKQAIAKDPNYGQAYAALAMAYLNFSNYSVSSPKESMPLAKAAALRALELDESLVGAHVVLARYRSEFEWDRAGGENEIRRAIELDPNNPRPHNFLSQLLSQQKKFDEAILEASRSQQLDPLSLVRALSFGERLSDARRYDEAMAHFQSLLLRDPNFANTHWDLGWTYFGKGMYRESVASYQKAFELDPDPVTRGYLAISYAKLGQRDEVLKQLEWLKKESPRRYVPSFAIALAYIALGQKDEAFTWLEKDMDERTIYASSYAIESALDGLREDPRFKAMLKRMNLPE